MSKLTPTSEWISMSVFARKASLGSPKTALRRAQDLQKQAREGGRPKLRLLKRRGRRGWWLVHWPTWLDLSKRGVTVEAERAGVADIAVVQRAHDERIEALELAVTRAIDMLNQVLKKHSERGQLLETLEDCRAEIRDLKRR